MKLYSIDKNISDSLALGTLAEMKAIIDQLSEVSKIEDEKTEKVLMHEV